MLPARMDHFQPAMLDELCAAGEVVWRGRGSATPTEGRVAFYLADSVELLALPIEPVSDASQQAILERLSQEGACFFPTLARAVGGFPNEVLEQLWSLVWAGHVTNDTLAPLRSLGLASRTAKKKSGQRRRAFRSRRAQRLPGSEGRWALWPLRGDTVSATERQTALANLLINRYGVLTREAVAAEGTPGGFAGLYPILKAMEEAGRVRRGYFVAGQGAAQFAAAGAEDKLRSIAREEKRDESPQGPRAVVLSAIDPANPYGAALRWPSDEAAGLRPQRTAGALVVLIGGALRGYLNRSREGLLTFLPADPLQREEASGELVAALVELAASQTVYLKQVDGLPVAQSSLATALREGGFVAFAEGYQCRAASVW